jgi:hypothetical protein
MDVLKPFLMLASVSFVLGFAGYLAVARVTTPAEAPAEHWSSTVSAPTADPGNPGRLI